MKPLFILLFAVIGQLLFTTTAEARFVVSHDLGPHANGRWHSDLTVSPGNHTLAVTANYDVGQYSATATSAFNVLGTNGVTDFYDGAGNVTNRLFTNGKTQSLKWDAAGRLVSLTQRDSAGSGFNWTAIYDALGRRLRTVNVPVVSNMVNSVMTETVDSFYDPQVEFQELAVSINGARTWKVMGPDLDGVYGSMNGLGGLEATVREDGGQTTPVLNDYFGNVVATISGTTLNWSSTRVSGYGAVVGYQAPLLTGSTPLADTLVWRSRKIDPSGFYYLGARYYDPMAGRFLSADPAGHDGSWDLYSFANGDPVNQFDADGRFGKQAYNTYARPQLQSSYDWLVDRNGTPGPYNNFANYLIGGTPSWLGIDPAPQHVYYTGDDRFTQSLIASDQFQSGRNALPFVQQEIANGGQVRRFSASLRDSPSYQFVKDIAGFATYGVVGGEYYSSYTGSWGGEWNIASQSQNTITINFSGMNPTTAASNTRMPFPLTWRYDYPSLQENVSTGKVMQNPVNIQWNGWTQLPTVRFQSPVVPFSSVLKENPFGLDGPLRSVYQHYDFQQTIPRPTPTQTQTSP